MVLRVCTEYIYHSVTVLRLEIRKREPHRNEPEKLDHEPENLDRNGNGIIPINSLPLTLDSKHNNQVM